MGRQTNRGQSARPYLRSVARTKTIDAGFLLGVQQPDAKAQLTAQDGVSLDTLVDTTVRDLRDLAWISIDDRASRDLDQVSVAELLEDGATRLRVAIADVDAWVPQGSPLDRHAAGNATSVFTGVVSYPMLPEPLAVGRASLIEGEDRLALVVELIVDWDGTVRSSDAYRALVRNQARLDYEEAGAWLEGEAAAPPATAESPTLGEQLRLHEAAVLALRDRRLAGGALDLIRAEVQPIFDDDRIVDMVVVLPNRARTMIEHLMVAVNAAIARFMSRSEMPWIARTQSPRDWNGLIELADEYGYELPDEPDRAAFGGLVHHLRTSDAAGFAVLQPVIARMLGGTEDLVMQPGEDPPPHYGLTLDGYTRATAPIRRYADLLAQRLLKAAIAGRPAPYTVAELDDLVDHARERGRAAETVEREMFKIYGTLLVQERMGEVFDATVTNATDYGVWARLDHPPVEGRLVQADASLDRGDRIRVRVTRTNWERGFVDLRLVP
ncbi:MAG TPA: RNB domain-containing ribonuclease [Herpetosiphonaceae bacterium]|nr:RNB domain-containing ribonuclease [Herpetosiphonaceae bacterium]